MTNTDAIRPSLSLFVVVRPAGARDCRDAAAFPVPAATDPVKAAREGIEHYALADDGTRMEWRTVASTDAGAARLEWPRATRSNSGRFTV